MKRQEFIKTTAAAAFSFQFIPRRVLGDGVTTPPSRKINLAAIGCGGQAASDLKNMAGENIVALCDVDERRAAGMFNQYPQASSPFEYGARLSEVGLLGIVAIRMSGQKLLYDEKAMRFTNHEAAKKQ